MVEAAEEATNGLVEARGALRDALAGILNLRLLLASRKVAPRAIAQLLGDLRGTCDEIVPSFLRGAQHPPEPGNVILTTSPLARGALDELGLFLAEQVRNFGAAIEKASEKTMNAASRLALEHAVGLVADQLSGALPLVELWADLSSTPRDIDLLELISLSRSGDQPQTLGTLTRDISLHVPSGLVELSAPPRAVLNFLGLLAACVDPTRKTAGFELWAAESSEIRANQFELRAQTQPGAASFKLLVPPHVAPTQPTTLAVAPLLGLNMRLDAPGTKVRLAVGDAP